MKPNLAAIAMSAGMLVIAAGSASALTGQPAPRPKISIYFPAGATRLTDEAQAVLDEAAKNVREASAPRVIIVGYGDHSGSTEANYSIAALRASTVEQGLIKRGIAPDAIVMTAEASPTEADGKVEFIGERKTDIIIEPASTKSF